MPAWTFPAPRFTAETDGADAREERPSTGHFDQRCEALAAEIAALKARVEALERAARAYRARHGARK